MEHFLHRFPELWQTDWLRRLVYSVCVFLIALLLTTVVRVAVRRLMRKNAGRNLRADTLSKLLISVSAFVVWFLAVMQILAVGLGVDVTSILAAAGVLGVAVGFGAQTLVRDVISGFFLLFENQFSVGERVTVDAFTGTVEELGLRSTKIRGDNGEILFLPNGTISKVVNLSRAAPPSSPND
ncbi:MAG: mechanosensitive ion channel family protein [Oscillospiraceae bacterium]|nr:mechanosensitive ion channel family protein [Oscillospiraceae bacterium]